MVLRGHIYSKVLEKDTGITVVGPSELNAGPYRVAYLLHGLSGTQDTWADHTMLPSYAQEHEILFVCPDAGRGFYTDMQYGARHYTYIAEELPALCASLFHISQKPADTVLIGGSMGGYGALQIALRNPSRFGACCAFAPACLYMEEFLCAIRKAAQSGDPHALRRFHGQNLFSDFQAILGPACTCPPQNELLHLARNLPAGGPLPQLYLACGSLDHLYPTNKRFAEDIAQLGLPFTFEEWRGGHDWAFFNEALKRALRWLIHK